MTTGDVTSSQVLMKRANGNRETCPCPRCHQQQDEDGESRNVSKPVPRIKILGILPKIPVCGEAARCFPSPPSPPGLQGERTRLWMDKLQK